MTDDERMAMFREILDQQAQMLDTHWRMLQVIAPIDFDDEFGGSEPNKVTLQ